MNAKITIARLLRWIVRLAGVAALVLGLLLWFDYPGSLLRPHMILGAITAISLALIALLASAAGVGILTTLTGFIWAALTLVVGYNQNALLIGSNHWIIEAAHLILGVGAIGLGETLVARMGRRSVVS